MEEEINSVVMEEKDNKERDDTTLRKILAFYEYRDSSAR